MFFTFVLQFLLPVQTSGIKAAARGTSTPLHEIVLRSDIFPLLQYIQTIPLFRPTSSRDMERQSPQPVVFFENTTLRRVDLPTQNMIFCKTIKWKVKSSNFYKMIAITTSFHVSLARKKKHAKLRPGRDRYR